MSGGNFSSWESIRFGVVVVRVLLGDYFIIIVAAVMDVCLWGIPFHSASLRKLVSKKLLRATALDFRHKSPKSMGFYVLEMTIEYCALCVVNGFLFDLFWFV